MKILVTGGTGLVGSNVIKVAHESYDAELVATVYKRQLALPWDIQGVDMDLEDIASVHKAIEMHRPEAVIHCAAPRDEDRLETDHEWGWRVMVTGTQAIAEACCNVGAKLVFVSSDWVFGQGGLPPYAEQSPPCPVNYFGLLKVVGETLVSSLCEHYAIVRIAGVYGTNWSDPFHVQMQAGVGFGWLANHVEYRLARGEPVILGTEHVNLLANPSLASDVADALLAAAHQDQQGVFHGAGCDGVSRLELARAVADVFGYDVGRVREAISEEMDPAARKGKLVPPRDSRLRVADSEVRLGRTNLGLYPGLQEYRRQLEELQRR